MRKPREKNIGVVGSIALVLMMISSTSVIASLVSEQSSVVAGGNSDDTVSVTFSVGTYSILTQNGQSLLSVNDFGHLRSPGVPSLPSKIVSIAIPPGAEVTSVSYQTNGEEQLSGILAIAPAQMSRVLSTDSSTFSTQQQKTYDDNYHAIYDNDEPYPSKIVEFVRSAGYRKYNLVDVQVTPFIYQPLSGKVIYYPEITIDVQYRPADTVTTMNDNLPKTEQVARDIILNYDQAQAWYQNALLQKASAEGYVIITLDSLRSSVNPIAAWEIIKGRSVHVVTTSWIEDTYEGYDLAEKIRNFLIEKYPSEQWGITNVLFVGHYDDVPMRETWQDLGYGRPETDLYFAELSKPDSESWDKNGNHQYGQTSVDPIDFYSEVNVGRIPWGDPDIVRHICEKSVAFEQTDDPSFKKNILLLGAYFWEDTDNANLMEKKIDQPWMTDWTKTRMYEQNVDVWSTFPCDYPLLEENVMSVWPTGKYSFVNWAGHGSPISSHILGLGQPPFITSYDCPMLNDEYPAIIFADACSNSDTNYENIGQTMLQQGAVGFVGATAVALGMPAWTDPADGSSQSFDYFFTTMVTSGEYTQGEALQRGLQQMYTDHLWEYRNYEMFEWGALWGNPDLGMTAITEYPFLELSDVTAKLGVTMTVTNTGTAPATNFPWTVTIKGGILRLIDKTVSGEITSLGINENVEIQSGILTWIGLGVVDITVSALNAQKTYSAVVVGPFMLRFTET